MNDFDSLHLNMQGIILAKKYFLLHFLPRATHALAASSSRASFYVASVHPTHPHAQSATLLWQRWMIGESNMVMNMLNGPRLNWHQFLSHEIFWDVWTEKKLLLKGMSWMRLIIVFLEPV